jgi:hypothetical protein
MFVGDSLNRQQWESMICLVQSVIPLDKKSLSSSSSFLSVFKIEVSLYSLKLRSLFIPRINHIDTDLVFVL